MNTMPHSCLKGDRWKLSYLDIKEKLTSSFLPWLVQSLFQLYCVNYVYYKHYICLKKYAKCPECIERRPQLQRWSEQLWWEKTEFLLLKCMIIAAPEVHTVCLDRKKDSALWFVNLHGMGLTLLEQYRLWEKWACKWLHSHNKLFVGVVMPAYVGLLGQSS